MNDFSHLDETGGISMVHVGSKRATTREAVAVATVRMQPATLKRLVDRALPKGDVLTTAKIAGVLAAKQTPSLIPLCHPLRLTAVAVDVVRPLGDVLIVGMNADASVRRGSRIIPERERDGASFSPGLPARAAPEQRRITSRRRRQSPVV